MALKKQLNLFFDDLAYYPHCTDNFADGQYRAKKTEAIRKKYIGFINFFLNADQRFAVLDQVQAQQDQFGRTSANAAKRVQVEFVSANPTSSLHVGMVVVPPMV